MVPIITLMPILIRILQDLASDTEIPTFSGKIQAIMTQLSVEFPDEKFLFEEVVLFYEALSPLIPIVEEEIKEVEKSTSLFCCATEKK